jgi:N,N'-diacetylbacillosaminyl-diphospho-undecaprenol alpha-1,3-N-acetylgalactosaminyltransferase
LSHKEGHEIFAVAPRGRYWKAFEKEGITPVHYDIERQSTNPFKEKAAVDSIYRAIRPLALDILHTFTAKPNIYGTFAARRAGIATVYNLVEGLGSFYIEESWRARLMRRVIEHLYKKAFRLSDLCVFVNPEDADYMVRKMIIPEKKVKIIRSVGVDTRHFSPEAVDQERVEVLRGELSPDGLPIVLMVARAIWHKGIREFYEAADRLRGRARFVLVGATDPGNPSCADETFLRSGVVHWLGERNDIAELTAACDIYVLPSYREGVPRTLLEGAAMGKCLVATNVTGCREVVRPGINGILVPPRDASALAEALLSLLKDPSLRRKMGAASRRIALDEFDLEKVVAQYLTLYQRASDVS